MEQRACNNGHRPIIFGYLREDEECPLCQAYVENAELKDQLTNAKDEIGDLKGEREELKSILNKIREASNG